MVYGKKKRPQKKKYTGCSTPSKIGAYATAGSKVVKLAADLYRLKQLVNVEFKWKDSHLGSTVGSSGTLVLLNGLAQGDGYNNREGVSIRNKSLLCKGYCTINASATGTIVRRVIFINRQPQNATPGASAVIDNVLTNLALGPRNLNNRSDIVILKDDMVHLSQNGDQIASFPDWYYDLNMHTYYSTGSSTGNIADISTGALYALYVSTEATNTPTIEAIHRLRFIDN